MTYYNANVLTDYSTTIRYHNISNIKDFIRMVENNISFLSIFFYRLSFRGDKKGVYCGYYNYRKGLQLF